MKFSKLGLIFSISYLGIFLLTGAYSVWFLIYNPLAELWGVLLIVITLPWSMILMPIIDSLGFIAWYDQFAGNHLIYGLIVMSTFIPAALINAIILYFIGRLFGGAVKQENPANIGAPIIPAGVDGLWKKFNLFFWIFFLLSIISFSLVFLPTAQLIKYIAFTNALGMIAKIGSIIVLSYFGYRITQKKHFLLLGLLGLLGGIFSAVGLIVGYIILLQAKKNLIRS